MLTNVAAATQILANAQKVLDSVREQAKGSKDATLKENISKLYDNLLDLKAAVLRLQEENAELRRMTERRADPTPETRHVGNAVYYFVGDRGPYCQPCYAGEGKLVMLNAQQMYMGGLGRKCELCSKVFIETPATPPSHTRREFGPWS